MLFAIVFFWTPPHTWALAMRYREDYAAADVPMLPVVMAAPDVAKRIMGYSVLTVLTSLIIIVIGVVGLGLAFGLGFGIGGGGGAAVGVLLGLATIVGLIYVSVLLALATPAYVMEGIGVATALIPVLLRSAASTEIV